MEYNDSFMSDECVRRTETVNAIMDMIVGFLMGVAFMWFGLPFLKLFIEN